MVAIAGRKVDKFFLMDVSADVVVQIIGRAAFGNSGCGLPPRQGCGFALAVDRASSIQLVRPLIGLIQGFEIFRVSVETIRASINFAGRVT